MTNLTKAITLAVILGLSAGAANAYWGGGPWGGYPGYYGGPWGGYPGYGSNSWADGLGDMFGDFDFNMSGRGWGRGYGDYYDYYGYGPYGYGYAPYGYGAPHWGGPYGGAPAPYAGQAPQQGGGQGSGGNADY